MEETTLEFYKERGQLQENRILELQQRNKDSNINEQSIDLDYDLYLEHEYLFLNVNLPGVLEQELKVELKRGEIIISGEFPKLCADEEVEFLERQRLGQRHYPGRRRRHLDSDEFRLDRCQRFCHRSHDPQPRLCHLCGGCRHRKGI